MDHSMCLSTTNRPSTHNCPIKNTDLSQTTEASIARLASLDTGVVLREHTNKLCNFTGCIIQAPQRRARVALKGTHCKLKIASTDDEDHTAMVRTSFNIAKGTTA